MHMSKLASLVFALFLMLGIAQNAGAGCTTTIKDLRTESHQDVCATIACERTPWSIVLWVVGFGATHVECVGGPTEGRVHAHNVKRGEVFNEYRLCKEIREALKANIDYESRSGTAQTECTATLETNGIVVTGTIYLPEYEFFEETITVDTSCMWCGDCNDDLGDCVHEEG